MNFHLKNSDFKNQLFSELFNNHQIEFEGKIKEGVNIIIYEMGDKEDSFIEDFISIINSSYKTKPQYALSLFYDGHYKEQFDKYVKYLTIEDNLYFRGLIKSLIPTHQKFINDKYKSIKNLENFISFPYSDKKFISFLYSLTIIHEHNHKNFISIINSFSEGLDNLTLTSASKLLDQKINNSKENIFISFEHKDSNFVNEYLDFYNFNKIYIKNSTNYVRETHKI